MKIYLEWQGLPLTEVDQEEGSNYILFSPSSEKAKKAILQVAWMWCSLTDK